MVNVFRTRVYHEMKHLISAPSSFFRARTEDIRGAVSFYVRKGLLFALIFMFVNVAVQFLATFNVSGLLSQSFILVFLGVPFVFLFLLSSSIAGIIWSLIDHLFLKILGGKGKFSDTVFVALASQTAVMSVMWIPVAGAFLFPLMELYSVYIRIAGFSEKHKISKFRVIAALVLPALVFGVLVFFAVVQLVRTGASPCLANALESFLS